MKVGELMKVIEGVAVGLAGVAKKPSDDLMAFLAGIRPFSDLNTNDFVAFVVKCEEYQRTGLIPAGKRVAAPKKAAAAAPSVADAVAAVRGILDQINRGGVTGTLIDETVARFKKMTKAQLEEVLKGLEIQGKPRTKDDAVGKVKQVLDTQFEMYIRTHPTPPPGPPELPFEQGHDP